MAGQAGSTRETVSQAAAAWAVRLSDPRCSDAERDAFARWRAQDHAHEAAFELESATWTRFDRLRALRPAELEPDPDLLAEETPPIPLRQPLLRRAAPRWAAAATVALTIGLTGVWLTNAGPAYATAVGERRVVVLEDGSRVELNTDTRIQVRYARGKRSVRLVRGEALFEVAPDRARPFEVAARDARVRASGTAFSVRLQPTGLQVMVTKGAVDIEKSPAQSKTPTETHLAAGAMGVYGPSGGFSRAVSAKEIDQTLAWRHGEIALDGETLEQAAGEFNRYSHRRLVVADPAIAGLRVGGYFRVDDMDGFVRALKTTFPVKAAQADQDTIYLSGAGAPA